MLILSADVVLDFLPKIKSNQHINEIKIKNKNLSATTRCLLFTLKMVKGI